MHPNLLKSMYVKRFILMLILILSGFAFYFIQTNPVTETVWFWCFLAGALLFGGLLFFMASVYFKRKKFKIAENNISYQEGVFFQKETVVPFARIQHIEIDEGPLERFYKTATLSIYTAGDSGRDLKISGLELIKAQEIKSYISNFIKDE